MDIDRQRTETIRSISSGRQEAPREEVFDHDAWEDEQERRHERRLERDRGQG
jgi:hypothetical protein